MALESHHVADFPKEVAADGEEPVLQTMATKDWSKTMLGPRESWSTTLSVAVTINLHSAFQNAIYWGPDYVLIYNQAWRDILGSHKHPWAMGLPAKEVWSEIWDIIEPQMRLVYNTKKGFYASDMLLPMHRSGYTEECYFCFTFSPIMLEDGTVGGLWNTAMESTQRVLGERRLKTLGELGVRTPGATSTLEACLLSLETLRNRRDIPYAFMYLKNDSTKALELVASTFDDNKLPDYLSDVPQTVDVGEEEGNTSRWPIQRVFLMQKPEEIKIASGCDVSDNAVLMPVVTSYDSGAAVAVIAFGVYKHRVLDEQYRDYYSLIVGHISTALTNARAREEERKNAQMLSELDQAKTVFFSNVSHEFRTPLTLMLAPLEDAILDTSLPTAVQDMLKMVFRNGQRLMKLVNTLLDFSRIEAGRHVASFVDTDIGSYTKELASSFESAAKQLQLELVLDCPAWNELSKVPVYLDRDMWEKIVLNLVSNALKFTWKGSIRVQVRLNAETRLG